mmetsp:Transcript_101292/g.285599  ORF Transcript_101292/g.285599 Transcript_101292/m.285599 type:complete len:512 (+) Transcript_101292:45-1580(+)
MSETECGRNSPRPCASGVCESGQVSPRMTDAAMPRRAPSSCPSSTGLLLEHGLGAVLAKLKWPTLLSFRRDLAIGPFGEALARLRSMGDDAVVAATLLQTAKSRTVVHALGSALGPCLRCWAYASKAAAVCAGRAALDRLSPGRRAALLRGIERGEGFCAVVRQHVARRGRWAFFELGRIRTAWLLGADADDPIALAPREVGGHVMARCRRGQPQSRSSRPRAKPPPAPPPRCAAMPRRSMRGAPATGEASLEKRLSRALGMIERSFLLELRRDLAMGFRDDALSHFRRLGGDGVASASDLLHAAADDIVVRALCCALGPAHRCWAYAPRAAAVRAGRNVLEALAQEKRAALLEGLTKGGGFCQTVRQHLGRSNSRALLVLGRPCTAWLLGASADDPVVEAAPKANACELRKKQDSEDWSSAGGSGSDEDVGDAEVDTEASTFADGSDSDEDVTDSTPGAMTGAVAEGAAIVADGEAADVAERGASRAFLREFRLRRLQQESSIRARRGVT